MIINLTNGIGSKAKLLTTLVHSMMTDYHNENNCDHYDIMSSILLTPAGSKEFMRWAKIRHGLNLRFFDIPLIDSKLESALIGYEITEDEHFTKYLLTVQQ